MDCIKKEEDSASHALLQHYDEFTDFNDDCAFLCDAFAMLAANNEYLNECSIRGLERHAESLKRRSEGLKLKLEQIRECYFQRGCEDG